MKRFSLYSIGGALLGAIFLPVARSRSQLGALDLGAQEIVGLVDDIKAAAAGTNEQVEKIGKSQHELAGRMAQLEQKGFVGGGAMSEQTTDSPGSLILKSPDLARLRSGEVKSIRVPIKGFEKKAAIVSGSVPASMQLNEVIGVLPRRVSLRSIIPVVPTAAGSLEFIQTTQTGVAGVQAVQATMKAEIGLSPVLVTAPVVTIAAFVDVATQMIADSAQFAQFIDSTLREAVAEAEDVEILNGPGGAGRMAGLMGAAVAYNRAVTGDSVIDAIRRSITQCQTQRGRPDALVLSPEMLERVELTKTADGEYIVQLVVDALGRTSIWRLAVVVSDALGSNAFLVGDFRNGALLADRQAMVVEVSEETGTNFKSNVATVRCEQRLALAVVRPQCFVKGTVS